MQLTEFLWTLRGNHHILLVSIKWPEISCETEESFTPINRRTRRLDASSPKFIDTHQFVIFGVRFQPDVPTDANFVLVADHLLAPLGFRHVVRCDGSNYGLFSLSMARFAQDILCEFSKIHQNCRYLHVKCLSIGSCLHPYWKYEVIVAFLPPILSALIHW